MKRIYDLNNDYACITTKASSLQPLSWVLSNKTNLIKRLDWSKTAPENLKEKLIFNLKNFLLKSFNISCFHDLRFEQKPSV